MRVRPLLVIGGVFGAAALTTVFVVSQLPREGQVSAPAHAAVAPGAGTTPALEPAAGPEDGALEVRVTAGRAAAADVAVRAYQHDPAAGWRRAGEARTAADGTVRLLARPGAYLVAARGAGLAPGRAEAIRGAREEVTRVEVVLEPAAALEGRVVERGGGAIAGARVRLIPAVSRFPGFAPPSAPAEEIAVAETGTGGSFRADGLAPGTYAVAVDATGYHPVLRRAAVPAEALVVSMEPLGRVAGVVLLDRAPAAGATVRAASADHGATATAGADGRFSLSAPAGSYRLHAALGDRAAAAGPIAVAAGATASPVELRLGPAAAIDGEVVLAAPAPRAGGGEVGSGPPAAGAEIAVFVHGTGEVAARARADAAGRFRIAGLPPDAFDVRASAPGASPALASAVTLAPGGRFPLRIALAGTSSIEGTVKDRAGRALAGVRVQIVQRGDGLGGAAPLEARSGFDGAWRIDGVEVGRAEIVARQDGVALGASRAVRVAEGRAVRADLFLAEAGVLAGRVRAGGRPPPAGTVVVAVPMRAGLGTLQVARAPADASGNYRLALPAGEYRVHAAPGDAARTDLRVTPAFARVTAGATASLDLPLSSAAAEGGLEILVLEPAGAPSPGAVVTLSRAGDAAVAFATSAGEDGRVALDARMGVAGRRVTIRARNGGRSGATTLDLPAAGTVPVTLSPGGAVQGRVRAAGRAPSGFTVEIASQPSPAAWRTVDVHRFTGDRFELGDLPAEPLRLVVRADDGRRGQAELSVGPGEVRTVEIALGR
ncbi:MAG TPA: carboxypeptidase-like regulatory domain-containing protein [Anaeromyxobacter sp.]|nr:carboxypeptidase-like regulatory domain-containing protein [Anaeromyxobacter sp.]